MPELEDEFLKPTVNLRNLQLLEEISKDASVSQRKLSQQLSLALGMTNACLKKMIKKGLVKAKGVNHKRIAYYLTPKGFSEKANLTYHFLEYTLRYYSRLKDNISAKFAFITNAGHRRIICYGASEVMEVAFIILNESNFGFSVLAIVDDDVNKHGKKMFGFEVRHPQTIKELKPDAVLITAIDHKDKIMCNLTTDRELAGINFYSL